MGELKKANDSRKQKNGCSCFLFSVCVLESSLPLQHRETRSGRPSHGRNVPNRNVIVLGVNATVLLCPPLSPATIKRTPRIQAALRRHRGKVREQRPLVTALWSFFPQCQLQALHLPLSEELSAHHYNAFDIIIQVNKNI